MKYFFHCNLKDIFIPLIAVKASTKSELFLHIFIPHNMINAILKFMKMVSFSFNHMLQLQ